ncbi:MAG: type IV-A pilus assembly ATPase PilB [Acidobacteriota bacterium]
MSSRLGEILIRKGHLTPEQLKEALSVQQQRGGRLSSTLIGLGLVSDEVVAKSLSEHYGLKPVDLSQVEIDPECLNLIPMETAYRYQVLPLYKSGNTLTVAIADPTEVLALDEIKFMTGFKVEAVVAPESAIRAALEKHYGDASSIEIQKVYDELVAEGEEYELDISDKGKIDVSELEKTSSEAPIIKLVNIILADAIRRGASDIHLEPYENEFRIRFRIDGVLYTTMRPPMRLKDAVVSRIKIMASLDISERRLPQDGRIKIVLSSGGSKKKIDFRVSTLPTLFGEKVVLRILDAEKLPRDLSQLGFEGDSLDKVRKAVLRPWGMVLVTGPTGSGKTSTLYTCLQMLNKEDVNIMTAEDPVEFNFPGINQVQINEQVGRTFAETLRAFLRQDPNIIMVGEIRDLETAEIAVKAALTGHLVLSTLHTNDAPSTISRMINMGVEPFLVASSVHLICAQRLVRVICSECKTEVPTPKEALIGLGVPETEIHRIRTFEGKGCANCNNTGYRGRTGLFEVMEVTGRIQDLILRNATPTEIRRAARLQGMLTLREVGLIKVAKGITTVDEVARETALVQ